MEVLKKFLQDPRLRIFINIFAIALIVWFGGPYIAIAGHSLLANADHRLIVMLILAIVWGIINLRLANKKITTTNIFAKKPAARIVISPPLKKINPIIADLKQLQKVFKNTLRLVKRSQKKYFWGLSGVPTFLVLGINHSGKTNLLTQANPAAPLPLLSEKYYDGWLLNNTVFFDYIETETKNEIDSLLWQKFLKLIKTNKRKLPFRGIIFTVDLSQLLNQNSAFNSEKICQRLQEMAVFFAQLPIYLVFTHCDLIAGFTDFFEDLNQEERAQALGFTFPNIKTSRNFNEVFDIQLNTLLKRLNERLIWRLHQEHNLQKRARIKDFPFQLEILKSSIATFVNQIGSVANVKLCGSYFTGSSRQEAPIDFLTTSLEKNFQIKQYPATAATKVLQNKNFFLENLLQQIINHAAEGNKKIVNNSHSHYISYGIGAIIFLGCSTFWLGNYIENLTTIKTLQLAITNSKNINDQNNMLAVLPYLNTLNLALEKVNNNHSLWAHLRLQQTDQVKIIATQTYQDLLTMHFLPAIKTALETQIQADATQNPAAAYNALKAYLMLADLKNRDPKFILQWFANFWQQQFPQTTLQLPEMSAELKQILQQKLTIIPDAHLVATAQNNLNQIPLSQLAYALLLDRYQQPLQIMDRNDVLTVNDNYVIPKLFSAKNLTAIYNQQILVIAQEVLHDHWILGDKNSAAITLDQLVNQLQTSYLNQYAAAWSQLLPKITLSNSQNLAQITHTFNILGDANSPLWQLLKEINTNTSAQEDNAQFNLIVSAKFQAIDNFVQSPAFVALQKSLAATKNYFNKIDTASNSNKAAFIAAAKRMENVDQNDVFEDLFQQITNLPAPLQSWINSLTTNSWHFMLANAQTYINQIWATAVLPQYNLAIKDKYPLFKDANNDINLQDFATFFGPGGILDNFFNNYLKPFVDMKNVYWVWKTVDNDRLGIPPTTLEMFIRAMVIQKMYFADGGNQPLVKFALVPLAIEPGVVDFNLNIDGQVINFEANHPPQITTLHWPGPNPDKVTVQFTNNRGKFATATETGPWAWFRLLAKANLQTAWKNPRSFKVTFDLNGNSVKYQLVASDLVNPFISGIVDVFRCPEKL